VKRLLVLVGVAALIVVMAGFLVWNYVNYLDYLNKTIHDTDRWAVIKDSKGDIISVETTNNEVWNTLFELNQNQTEMWIGGFVETYGNKWAFRFKPDTIVIAEVTIEGAQSNIKAISEHLDYWINTWANIAYVFAKVIEVHQ
jgi:hypothetical protein